MYIQEVCFSASCICLKEDPSTATETRPPQSRALAHHTGCLPSHPTPVSHLSKWRISPQNCRPRAAWAASFHRGYPSKIESAGRIRLSTRLVLLICPMRARAPSLSLPPPYPLCLHTHTHTLTRSLSPSPLSPSFSLYIHLSTYLTIPSAALSSHCGLVA